MKMFVHIIKAVLILTLLLICRIPFILVSPFIVAIGLLFEKEEITYRPHPWGKWKLMKMPKIFWPWDNDRDGNLGDVKGKYANIQAPKFLSPYWKKWYWLVVRNPVNNISRHVPGINCDVSKNHVELLAGKAIISDSSWLTGYQFCKAGKFYYGFYLVTKPIIGQRGFRIRMGYKIAPQA